MCKLKVGDKFKVIEASGFHKFIHGDIVELVNNDGSENMLCERMKDKTTQYIHLSHLEYIGSYEDSNRFKLLQAIKETGYSSRRLSDIAVGNESYFYNYTGKARFDKKGDISDSMLEQLKGSVKSAQSQLTNKLTDALIHEREDLDLAPKTVDENNVPIVEKSIDGSVVEAKAALDTFSDNTQKTIELQKKFFDSANKLIQKKKDSKVRNFLIVFVLVILVLALWFFVR